MSRIVVNPVACDGIGVCAHLAPDLVRLDPWGYPILARGPLSERARRQAARAVAGCPRRALLLDDTDARGEGRGGGPPAVGPRLPPPPGEPPPQRQ